MNEHLNNPQAAFMEIASKKIDLQDNKIETIEKELRFIPANTAAIEKLTATIENEQMDKEKWMQLSKNLETCTCALQQPRETTIRHKHQISKKIWVTAGIFLVLCLVLTGWYNTADKLDNYIANDTKYRYLKLDTSNKPFQIYLLMVDSLYNTNGSLRKTVMAQEAQNRLNFERLQQAAELKEQARELENKVRRK